MRIPCRQIWCFMLQAVSDRDTISGDSEHVLGVESLAGNSPKK
jgi:hypothetical protein